MSLPHKPSRTRVQKAVRAGILHWRIKNGIVSEKHVNAIEVQPAADILKPMERRASVDQYQVNDLDIFPSLQKIKFKGARLYSFVRLLTWISVIFQNISGNAVDWLLRRSSVERKAVRLRESLERAGGTFVKIGQQAAMRIDLLPWAYCNELSRMHDRMVPFDVSKALAAFERTTGNSWKDTFSVFDPEPIGSASISCVFQAVLKDGSKVAVKVRRPNIVKIFLGDLQVLDWFSKIAEFLSIFRNGFTTNLRSELRETLLDELDFRKEARFQSTFKRNAPKSGKSYFNAPKVFFELSGEEVLVQEFVEGLWLREVISAVESHDPKGRAKLRSMNIDPKIVARRIMWVAFWTMDEQIFFHADPHPANILVRPNNELTFIDFGSCGSFNNHQRVALEQMVLSMVKQDPEGMALATISLMEPLPQIDVAKFIRDAQSENILLLNTFNTPSKYTEYWERTSARQWVVLFKTARKYNISLNMHMLRMIRATLLYDSIVLRLDNHLDRYHEYTEFMKDRAEMIKQRWRKNARNSGPDGLLLKVEELGSSLSDLMLRTQSVLGKPIVNFGTRIDKLIFSATVFTRFAARIMLISLIAVLFIALKNLLIGDVTTLVTIIADLLINPIYLAIVVVLLILNIRIIAFRISDRDPTS